MTNPLSGVVMTAEELAKLTTLELLGIKRAVKHINSAVIERVAGRLTQVVSERMGEAVNVFWEDISLWPNDDVMIVGIRMFQVGDIIDADGEQIEIDEDNVATLAQRIRLMFPKNVFEMINDPSTSIKDIVDGLDSAPPPGRFDDDPVDLDTDVPRITHPATASMPDHPLETDPLVQWLYVQHNKSTTKH